MRKSKGRSSIIKMALESNCTFSAFLTPLPLVFAFVLLPSLSLSSSVLKILVPMLQSCSILMAACFAMISITKLMLDIFSKSREKQSIEFLSIPSQKTTNSTIKERIAPTINLPEENTKLSESVESNLVKKVEPAQNLWTLEFINTLDWKVFETLCSQYFDAKGLRNNETSLGADGGVDLIIYENDTAKPTAIAQCKKWSNPIKVGALREFYGVMSQYHVAKGYFFTTNEFYKTAIKFAEENNIDLINGALLISLLKGLDAKQQEKIYKLITTGDYTTPTCVRCGKKMVLRKNKKTLEEFWGCNTYRCGSILNIKSKSKDSNNASSLLY